MEEVFPKVVATPFGIPIRDTVIETWVAMGIIIILVLILKKKMPTALEMLIEFLRNQIAGVIGERDVDLYVPFMGTLVVFLALVNNLSVIPIVGAPTRDINAPVALAVVVFFAVRYFGFRKMGVWGYLKQKLSPMVILDVITDVSRTISLSLRLFGNVIAAEIIVAVIYRLVKPMAPLLLVALGLITGVLQAYIFMFLTLSAVSQAVQSSE